jgi:hypothetical protein
MIFPQKKINIQLKYFPGKFGNSGESDSCPGSPVKKSKCWSIGMYGQVLAWSSHNNVAGLNWLMGSQTLPPSNN